ncbi:cardiotrophin-2-like [Tiliqua scincoides]|uniref:cardiotrophin-2-like n=1 Tax=Tiliqua scincoides TaxID=71010 RepID=UPI00346209FF
MTLSLASSLLVICAFLFHVVSPDPKCSLSATIAQTFNLARHMRVNSTVLLDTYLRHQGTPFSDPDFGAQRLHYEGVPTAAIPFLEWRTLSNDKRLEKNYEAYFALSEFLQLVWDDQSELNSGEGELLEMLRVTQLHIQGLLSNLTCIMTAMGVPVTPRGDSLMLETTGVNIFEKKVRGYVVCHTYKEWIDRTVRDFSLLGEKFPV